MEFLSRGSPDGMITARRASCLAVCGGAGVNGYRSTSLDERLSQSYTAPLRFREEPVLRSPKV